MALTCIRSYSLYPEKEKEKEKICRKIQKVNLKKGLIFEKKF